MPETAHLIISEAVLHTDGAWAQADELPKRAVIIQTGTHTERAAFLLLLLLLCVWTAAMAAEAEGAFC
jgi:hypothetical protein